MNAEPEHRGAYVLEDSAEGRTLVVTGAWSDEAARALSQGEADGLVLNYARGFSERDLAFLDRWPVRRLRILHRDISDLAPIGRLADSLESLSVQAAPGAELDPEGLPHLRSIAGEWALLRSTVARLEDLQTVVTWRFDEPDPHAFRDLVALERLTIKEAPHLQSLSGVADLAELAVLGVFLARELDDIDDAAERADSLRELEFEACPKITALDAFEPLHHVRFLGVSECRDIESLSGRVDGRARGSVRMGVDASSR